MLITISTSGPRAAADAPRDVTTAVLNGLKCRCPKCGQGKLFRAYLKVVDACPACGEALHHNRTDDAPPWAVMLIVCHIVVGGVLSMEQAWTPPIWLMMAIWMPTTIALCLALLPIVKGGFVGLQWGLRMHGFGAGADPADPQPEPLPAEGR
jgi:uncharacterized protein (DUF983 family)